MTDIARDSAPSAGVRRPYETPVLADLGSVAAVTANIDKIGGKDGGANNIKS